MGVWYFLLLFLGLALLAVGLLNKNVSRSTKCVTLLLVVGINLLFIATLLFLPGSSTLLDQLFQVGQ